jgi:hypothetical protein
MMPRLRFGSSELLAVPAVHHRAVFAEVLNRACRDEGSRPEAVAVELSQDAVDAVVKWFKELGVGSTDNHKIPCMVGLAKSNRRIHPRYKQAALRLQEMHGKPLHEISPGILCRELNFAPVALLCLSATDSIIEAIRSAVEMGLPVYGVDLGDLANTEQTPVMLQDPILAQGALVDYVKRNESACISHRDAVVDVRRELVMAARLKRLLKDYRQVLFTGGIGHWRALEQRLSDAQLAPATLASASELEKYQRVIVAPSMAVHQMDVIPALTAHYENIRALPPDAPERHLNYPAILRTCLAEACARAETKNPEMIPAFCQYLANRCLLNQSRVPDLFLILNAARDMISADFAHKLGKILVTDALDWANARQWPHLPYFRQTEGAHDELTAALPADIIEHGKISFRTYVIHRCESWKLNDDPLLPDISNLDPMPRKKQSPGIGYSWVWPPGETLLFATAYTASNIVDHKLRERCPEPFTGSLHEGVDAKATLRSFIQGEHRIQVKALSAPTRMSLRTKDDDEPTVFIFESEARIRGGRWDTLLAGCGYEIRKFVQDQKRYDEITGRRGDGFIAAVEFFSNPEPDERLKAHLSEFRYLYGVTIFGNPSLNNLQSARWLESCDYTGCPILRWRSIETLFEYYQQEHHLALDHHKWVSSLVRIALPYAKRRVVVVLPKNQDIETSVLRDAANRRVGIERMSLASFPSERIDAIRKQCLVQSLDVNKMEYPKALSDAFGESPRAHLDLLPARIRAQLNPIT